MNAPSCSICTEPFSLCVTKLPIELNVLHCPICRKKCIVGHDFFPRNYSLMDVLSQFKFQQHQLPTTDDNANKMDSNMEDAQSSGMLPASSAAAAAAGAANNAGDINSSSASQQQNNDNPSSSSSASVQDDHIRPPERRMSASSNSGSSPLLSSANNGNNNNNQAGAISNAAVQAGVPPGAFPSADMEDWKQRLRVGDVVDCKGCIKEWLPAEVVRRQLGLVRVHYLSWPNAWDEWLHLESGRVAPLGSFTNVAPTDKFAVGQQVEVLPPNEVDGHVWVAATVHQIRGHNVCVWIPKPNGGFKPLWYSADEDRIRAVRPPASDVEAEPRPPSQEVAGQQQNQNKLPASRSWFRRLFSGCTVARE